MGYVFAGRYFLWGPVTAVGSSSACNSAAAKAAPGRIFKADAVPCVLFSITLSLSWNYFCAIRCWGSSGTGLLLLEHDLTAFITQNFPVCSQRSDGHKYHAIE